MIRQRVTIQYDERFATGNDDPSKELAASPGMEAALEMISRVQLMWLSPVTFCREVQEDVATMHPWKVMEKYDLCFQDGTNPNKDLRLALSITSLIACDIIEHAATIIELKMEFRRNGLPIYYFKVCFDKSGVQLHSSMWSDAPIAELVRVTQIMAAH